MSEAEDRRKLAELGIDLDEAEMQRILRGIADERETARKLREWLREREQADAARHS